MMAKKSMNTKNLLYLGLLFLGFAIISCSSDDDGTVTPPPIIEVNDCEPYTATPAFGTINSEWTAPNEEDRYDGVITIPSDPGGGYVRVLLTQDHPDLRPWLTISNDLDAGGAIVSGSSANTNNELNREAYFSVHPGTTFSLEVFPFFNAPVDDYPVSYTIEWEFFSRVDCFESNDTQATAKKILFDETIEAYAIAGHIGYGVGSFDEQTYDWYKVNLTEPGFIESEVLDMPSDMTIQMRLFKTDGSTVSIIHEWLDPDSPNSNGRRSRIKSSQSLAPGTYYIELHPDFVKSRKSSFDTEPIPEHFNKTYKIKTISY